MMSCNRMPSQEQVEKLVEMLEQNPGLAMGHARTTFARHRMQHGWKEIAAILNGQSDGCVKSWQQWSKYWKDKKGAVKRKANTSNLSCNLSVDGLGEVAELTDIEGRILLLMGGVRVAVSPYENKYPAPSTAAIRSSTPDFVPSPSNLECSLLTPSVQTVVPKIEPSSPEPDDNTKPHEDRDQAQVKRRIAARRLLRRSLPTQPRNHMGSLTDRFIRIEERLVAIQEQRAESEANMIRVLERLSQAWVDQTQSLMIISNALNAVVERLNR